MTAFRRILMALAAINVLFTIFTAAVGLFADGGDIWSRLVLAGLHPLSAIAIILLVFIRHPNTALVSGITAILAINIIADLTLATIIASDAIEGDWPLPLVFAIIPTIAIVYAVKDLRTERRPSDNANQPAGS